MSEPTYRIAQALHARRAAVGLPKYGQHLSAASPGCMLVHALEESADKTNYLIAEVQRRQSLMKWLRVISDEKGPWADWAWGWFVDFGGEAALAKYDEILGTVAEDATVAPEPTDAAKVDPRKIVAEAIADLSAEQPELREYRFSRYVNGKLKAEGAVVMATSDQHAAEKLTKLCCDHPAILIGGQVPPAPDPRDEALRVATEALEKQRRGMENILEFRQLRTAIGEEERFGALTRSEIEEVIQQIDGYLAAIRGAR